MLNQYTCNVVIDGCRFVILHVLCIVHCRLSVDSVIDSSLGFVYQMMNVPILRDVAIKHNPTACYGAMSFKTFFDVCILGL